jgi:hypothetical protein
VVIVSILKELSKSIKTGSLFDTIIFSIWSIGIIKAIFYKTTPFIRSIKHPLPLPLPLYIQPGITING